MNSIATLLWLVVFFGGNPVTLKPQDTGDFLVKRAWYNGSAVYFTPFAATDPNVAQEMNHWATKFSKPGDFFFVDYAPALNRLLDEQKDVFGDVYLIDCAQQIVFNSEPGVPGYTPLWRVHVLDWAAGVPQRPLISEADVLDATSKGDLVSIAPISVLDATIVQNSSRQLIPQAGDFEISDTQREIHLPTFQIVITRKNQLPRRLVLRVALTESSDPVIADAVGAYYTPRIAAAANGCTNSIWAFANPVPWGQDPVIDQVQSYKNQTPPWNTNADYTPLKSWSILSRGTLPYYSTISGVDSIKFLLNSGIISQIPTDEIVTNSSIPQSLD